MAYVRVDPNHMKPFSLSHDPTPQSFSQEPLYKSVPNLYEENFRFKGFPGHGFSRPTIPRTVPLDGPIPVHESPRVAPQKQAPPPPQKPPTPISNRPPHPQQEEHRESVPALKMQDNKPQSPLGTRRSPDLEHQGYVPSMMENDNSPPSRRSDPDKENQEPLPQTRYSWELYDDQEIPSQYYNYNQYLTEDQDGPKPPVTFQEDQPDYTYRSQGRPRFDEVNGQSPRPIPIRRAYEKTDEEIRRIEQQHLDADRDQRRIQAETQYRDMERLAEQKKDYQMLQNYNPWGKPGAGAPGDNDVRKKKFTEEQFANEDRMNSPNWQRPPDRYLGRDWASKTAEEKQRYRNDLMEQEGTQRRMAETERNADMGREMGRPTPPMGRHEERKLHEQQQRLSELKNELDNVKMGRAQSSQLGGSAREASARDASAREKSAREGSAREGSIRSYYEKGMKLHPRRKVYNSWDQYEMKRVQTRESFDRRRDTHIPLGDSTYRSSYDQSPRNDDYDPWGKGLGNPHFDPEGNVARHEHMLGRTNKQLPTQIGEHYGNYGSWSAPDRVVDNTEPRIRHNPYDNLGRAGKAKKPNMEQAEIFFPFGKSGAGAPRIDRNARITTQNKGTMSKEEDEDEHMRKIRSQREYLHELDVLYQQQKRNKDYINEYNKAPPGDLASIMKAKQVGKPRRDPDGNLSQNQHLGNSDVSLTKMNRPEKNTAMQQEYLETLNRHNVARQTQRNLDLQKDRQGDRLHQHAIDSWWGNYGGGNKKGPVLQKQNLDVTIHHPTTSFSMTDEYIRNKDWSQIGDEHIQMFPHLDEKNSPRFATYGESSPRIYPRSTVNSTHNNQYDYPWESLPKKDYKIGAPYALH